MTTRVLVTFEVEFALTVRPRRAQLREVVEPLLEPARAELVKSLPLVRSVTLREVRRA